MSDKKTYFDLELEIELEIKTQDDWICFYPVVQANYDWQPYEPEVRHYPDGSGYPGCAAQVEGVYDITCKTDSLQGLFDYLITRKKFEKIIEEKLEEEAYRIEEERLEDERW